MGVGGELCYQEIAFTFSVQCRGTQHVTGIVYNEATSDMGFKG